MGHGTDDGRRDHAGRAREERRPSPQDGQHVTAVAAGVGVRDRAHGQRDQGVPEQGRAVRPPAVEHGLAGARPGRDGLHGHGLTLEVSMPRLPLPPARPVLHPLRDVATATASIQEFPGRRRRVTIDHRPLAGVTPVMPDWWFRHIGGSMTYASAVTPNYLVWHPLDHIRWELAPGVLRRHDGHRGEARSDGHPAGAATRRCADPPAGAHVVGR
jgi:hypothetical protein